MTDNYRTESAKPTGSGELLGQKQICGATIKFYQDGSAAIEAPDNRICSLVANFYCEEMGYCPAKNQAVSDQEKTFVFLMKKSRAV